MPTFTSTRTFTGTIDSQSFSYGAGGRWKGTLISGAGGVSYAVPIGDHFKIKPRATIEYFRLKENGYTETGNAPLALTLAGLLATGWSGIPLTGAPHTNQVGVTAGFQRRIFSIDASSNAQTFLRLRFTLQPTNNP